MPSTVPPEGTWARMFYNLYQWQQRNAQPYARPGSATAAQMGQTWQRGQQTYNSQYQGMASLYGQQINGIAQPTTNLHQVPTMPPIGQTPSPMPSGVNPNQAPGPMPSGVNPNQAPGPVAPPTPATLHNLPTFTPGEVGTGGPVGSYAGGSAGWTGWAPYTMQPGTRMSPQMAAMQARFNAVQAGLPDPGASATNNVQMQQPDIRWDPESKMYGYRGVAPGTEGNVYTPEGKKQGRVGSSGLWWRSTRRQTGKNYRYMRQQAEATGTLVELQTKLRKARDNRGKKGFGTGRDQWQKNNAKTGNNPAPTGTKQQGGNNGGYYGNSLVQWQW